jgi:hypothetical protein
VLVLRERGSENLAKSEWGSDNGLDTNPRILAIAFAQPKGGHSLVLENHALIPRHTEFNIKDSFAAAKRWASIAVSNGMATRNSSISNGTLSYYQSSANSSNMESTNGLRGVLAEISGI